MKFKKIILLLIIFILLVIINIYNSMTANVTQTKVRTETLVSEKIDPSFDDYLIVFFSDLYYENEEKLADVVNKINMVNPDLVIFGGDLLKDKDDNSTIATISEYLASIKAKDGKYAVYGENDYLHLEAVNNIYQNSGFQVLVNEGLKLFNNTGAYINLIGLNSLSSILNVSDAFVDVSNGYTIVVSHEPDTYDYINYNFDYLLAGHSLGGETYIPLINVFYRPFGANNYYHGKYYKEDNTIDVTNGLGLKEKTARFLADSEIVFYKLSSH